MITLIMLILFFCFAGVGIAFDLSGFCLTQDYDDYYDYADFIFLFCGGWDCF